MGELEMLILNIIWAHPDSTVKEIHSLLLEEGKEAARTTVLTIIQRLEGKGYLQRNKEKRATTYVAVKKRESVLKNISSKFIKTMLGGSVKPALQCFLEDNPSEEELAEIDKILKDYKKKK